MPEFTPRFTIDDIAVFPPPGYNLPSRFGFSLDGTRLMFLAGEGDDPTLKLHIWDAASGSPIAVIGAPAGGTREEDLTLEEELRRQRERNLSVGITRYSRAEASDRLLVPVGNALYVVDPGTTDLRLVTDRSGQPTLIDPKLSADGNWIAFVQDAEVYVVAAEGGEPQQITSAARGTGKTNGLAEYIAQEEMGRYDGYWWSPDSLQIAYTEVDETHIPVYRIMHQGKDELGDTAQEDHRYPLAGTANAIVRLGVLSREGGDPTWMDLDYGQEMYLARVFWWPDASLGAQVMDRAQSFIDLLRFDAATGQRSLVLHEEADTWVNLRRRHFMPLEQGGFLWASERDGFNHLYLYGPDGDLVRQLTRGEWVVDDILAVNEEAQAVFFSGNREHPTQAHVYSVGFDGEEITRLSPAGGTHAASIAPTFDRYVLIRSGLGAPPSATLHSMTERKTISIHQPTDPRLEPFDLQPPELVELTNRDGTTLHGAIYRPPADFGDGPFPVIVHVYGGPGPQMVTDSWRTTANLQLQYLRSLGYLVFRLDNRGSARRGRAFEGALKQRMGTVEVDDQVDGVRWLIKQGLADPERIGVTGWSYGGYMALMCLAKASDLFKVGVAGAPVTDWSGYDTCYTERYMGTPQENPDGYTAGNVLDLADQISGDLLIVHGMLDENVHFRHTARLINALNRARKRYDLLIFPDERHMPRREYDRVTLHERIIGFFQDHL
ncbi:MAG: alpha/beta fold hydrolase [Chloroflexi bacterium]|nr:alpha/beta fold hydrolase [Chloroflexota bacterium]